MSSWRQANRYFHISQFFYHFSIFISRYFRSLLYLRAYPLSIFQVLFNYNLLCFIHLIWLELLLSVTTFLALHDFVAAIIRCGITLAVIFFIITLTLFAAHRPLDDWMLSLLISRVIRSASPCSERVLLVPDTTAACA